MPMNLTPEQRRIMGERLRAGKVAKQSPKVQTWADLPTYANRCAKASGIPESAPVHEMLCVECKKPMWTRDEKREDLCEGCEYLLKERIADMGQHNRAAASDRLVVPTGVGGDNFLNPLKGGGGGLF